MKIKSNERSCFFLKVKLSQGELLPIFHFKSVFQCAYYATYKIIYLFIFHISLIVLFMLMSKSNNNTCNNKQPIICELLVLLPMLISNFDLMVAVQLKKILLNVV